ncbi:MAG: S8 family serine peptidase [Bacteroidota bacterium]
MRLALVAALFAVLPTVHAQPDDLAAKAARDGSVRVIVLLDAQAKAPDLAAKQGDVLSRLQEPKRVARFAITPGFAVTVGAEDLARLRATDGVASVHEDRLSAPTALGSSVLGSFNLATSTRLIGAQDMWGAGFTGAGTEIAVLDSGFDTDHPLLRDQIASEACFSSKGTGTDSEGVEYTYESLCPDRSEEQIGEGAAEACDSGLWTDDCEHGTHVAGIAAGNDRALIRAQRGVAPSAEVTAIQVFSGFTGTGICRGQETCALTWDSDQILALEHVYLLVTEEDRPIVAVNMSLGGGGSRGACDNAPHTWLIDLLRSIDVATIVSSGNNGYNGLLSYPACISSAVSVGATDFNDRIAEFSNIASDLDLLAPGVEILSAVPGGAYEEKDGTSMAAPHVAGAWALLRHRFPDEDVETTLDRLQSRGERVALGPYAFTRIRVDDAGLNPAAAQIGPSAVSLAVPVGGTASRTLRLHNPGVEPQSTLRWRAEIRDEGRQPERPAAGRDGPDAYGYTAQDSREADGPAFEWIDVLDGGLTLQMERFGYVLLPLPFEFPFYGTFRDRVWVNANGFMTFQDPGDINGVPRRIPDAGAPNAVIAANWDWWESKETTRYGFKTLPDGRFVFSWISVGDQFETTSFQIILSRDGRIQLQLKSLWGWSDAAIGVENDIGTDGVVVSYRDEPLQTLYDLAIRLDPNDGWLSVSEGSGTVGSGGVQEVTLGVDAAGLAPGAYTAEVVVQSNDPVNPEVIVPVTMVVSDEATPASGIVAGAPGWRLMGTPELLTISRAAEMNLVAGIPGNYPDFGSPTLFTHFDGTQWRAPFLNESIAVGQGFMWYFFDEAFTPEGPALVPSSAVEMPVVFSPLLFANSRDREVELHTEGSRFNVLGNPFSRPLDIGTPQSWPGGSRSVGDRAYTWNAEDGTWEVARRGTTVGPYEGFVVRAKRRGGTLTIPASSVVDVAADASGGTASKADDVPRLGLVFEGREAETGRRLVDRAAEVAFSSGAVRGWDEGDAEKLAPLSDVFVALGVVAEQEGRPVLKAADAMAEPTGRVEVPLAIQTAGAEAEVTLRWIGLETLPTSWRLSLLDRQSGERLDLRAHEGYAFRHASEVPDLASGPPTIREAELSAATERFLLVIETDDDDTEGVTTWLEPVRPNPVSGPGTLAFTLASDGDATLAIYDVRGREVARLAEGAHAVGRYEVPWPESLAPGVYVARLATGTFVDVQRVVVVR